MANLRSQLSDDEQTGALVGPTSFKTGANQHEVRCGMCGDICYVTESIRDQILAAIETGLDNPFSCPNCEAEYDELAYEG